jgi:hypothetical protein
VELPVSTYEDVRGEGEWFLVVSGHENPTIERVIKRVGNVVVVERTVADRPQGRATTSSGST